MTSLIGEGKLVIQEITGPKRELVLTGRSMPFSPASLGGVQQRKQVTYYAGNPVASTQVFGLEELPANLDGHFADKFLTTSGKILLDNLPVLRANDAYDALESFATGLQLLKVNWAGRERWGFLDRIEPSYKTRTDVWWNTQWTWVSRRETSDPPQAALLGQVGDSLPELFDEVTKAVQQSIELLRVAFGEMDDKVMETLRDLENGSRQVEVVASLGVELAQGGLEVADRVMEALYSAQRSTKNVANQARAMQIIDNASYMGWSFGSGSRHAMPPGTPPDISSAASRGGLDSGSFGAGFTGADVAGADGIGDQSLLSGGSGSNAPGSTPRAWHEPENSGMDFERLDPSDPAINAIAQDPAAYLRKLVTRDEAIELLLRSSFEYAQAAEAIRSIVRPEAKAIHTMERGQDLRHVSIQYYGSQDRWTDIANVNDIDGSMPDVGTRLVIPR